ncbi:MAG: SGNH/GDSL hydrolase family protein [Aeromicrobium sp.]
MHSRRSCGIALVVLTALASCTEGSSEATKNPSSYVALGDSYVSGPLIPASDPSAPECLRSLDNYPHLVAAALDGSRFVDVSCAGATTEDVRRAIKGRSAQLDAVGPKTQLVTVGIGANDAGLAKAWFNYCLLDSRSDATCEAFASKYSAILLSQTRERVVAALKEIKGRAPDAKILLVGYLRITPESGPCEVLPISEANREASARYERNVSVMLRTASKDTDVDFVDAWAISKGHDACAGKKAWVNGLTNGDGAYLHPNSLGMEAVAREVLRVLRDEQRG